MNVGEYINTALTWLKESGPTIILILVIAAVAFILGRLIIAGIFGLIRKRQLSDRFDNLIKTLHSLLKTILTISVIFGAGYYVIREAGADVSEIWASSILRILLILIIGYFTLKAARFIADLLFASLRKEDMGIEGQKRADTLSGLIRYILFVAITITAVMMILDELGIAIGPILATAGVVGLAIGFGAQYLVQDIISGFFILMQDQIRVGDVVQIAGKGGLVERVNLKMTVLRDLSGNVHYIRNGLIDVVTNMTKDYSFALFEIGVAYRERYDEIVGVLKEVDEELRADDGFSADILDPMEIMGLDKFADSAVVIKARIKTKPIKQWRVMREFNRRMKLKFDERDIEIPFPHMTVYMGKDKQGDAPPLNVAMQAGETLEQSESK